jgi:hypothetical protein
MPHIVPRRREFIGIPGNSGYPMIHSLLSVPVHTG